jgi:hypothetical protein
VLRHANGHLVEVGLIVREVPGGDEEDGPQHRARDDLRDVEAGDDRIIEPVAQLRAPTPEVSKDGEG